MIKTSGCSKIDKCKREVSEHYFKRICLRDYKSCAENWVVPSIHKKAMGPSKEVIK